MRSGRVYGTQPPRTMRGVMDDRSGSANRRVAAAGLVAQHDCKRKKPDPGKQDRQMVGVAEKRQPRGLSGAFGDYDANHSEICAQGRYQSCRQTFLPAVSQSGIARWIWFIGGFLRLPDRTPHATILTDDEQSDVLCQGLTLLRLLKCRALAGDRLGVIRAPRILVHRVLLDRRLLCVLAARLNAERAGDPARKKSPVRRRGVWGMVNENESATLTRAGGRCCTAAWVLEDRAFGTSGDKCTKRYRN